MKTLFSLYFVFLFSVLFGQENLFEHYTVSDGIPNGVIYDIQSDEEGTVWISSPEGVFYLEGINFSHLPNSSKQLIQFFRPIPSQLIGYSLSGRLARITKSIITEINVPKKIQIQLRNSKLFQLNIRFDKNEIDLGTNKGRIVIFNNEIISDSSFEKSFQIINKKNNANWWQSNSNNLQVHFNNETTLTNFDFQLSNDSSSAVCHFLKLADSTFLFSHNSEIIHFDNQQVLARIFTEKNITDILQTPQGAIWLGLLKGGLIYYPNEQLLGTQKINYLGNKTIVGLTKTNDGSLWIATETDGLYRYQNNVNLHYKSPVFFSDTNKTESSKQAVIVANRANQISKNSDHRVIKTEALRYDTIPPTIHINSVQIMGQDTTFQNSYSLPYSSNFITIKYIGFAYNDPQSIQYRYKLFGVDKKWIFTSNTSAQYTTLPPGNYTFLVAAMNKNGIWSDSPKRIDFKIAFPFWKTWWFWITATIFIISIISSLVYWWWWNLKRKETEKIEITKQLASVELQALRSQMNPHFIFNTMSSIQYYITLNDKKEALNYLSKFAKLMRTIIENSKSSTITLQKEIEGLELYLQLECMRFKGKISYELLIAKNIDTNHTEIPSMLIQPYIENAILHGLMHKTEKGKVTVSISKTKENLICTVEDDGIGREQSTLIKKTKTNTHKSFGMSITKERLQIMNTLYSSKLNVKITDLKQGTRVRISIPLIED